MYDLEKEGEMSIMESHKLRRNMEKNIDLI